MEDDDIEYDITFPSPVSVPDVDGDIDGNYLEQREPVVILLGWLGCKEKYIAKYSQIYEQRGCITITYTAESDVAFFKSWKLKDIASKILDLLEDYSVTENPILFHIFSNNGSYVYHSIVDVLTYGDERYRKLQVYGVIIDSAPGKARILRAAKAYAASLQVTGLRRYFVMFSMMAFLFFTAIKAWLLSFINNKYIENDQHHLFDQMANESSRWPELYLYSKADKVVSHYDIEDMIERRKKIGIHVDGMCWESSDHVSHLRKYPDAYTEACSEFLSYCLSTSLATGDVQETSDEENLLVNKTRCTNNKC